MKAANSEKGGQIRVSIDYNKQHFLMRFPTGTKVLYLQEFLKRTIKIKPTETVYLFVKEQRKLMTPSKSIDDYAKIPGKFELREAEHLDESVLNIVVRKTDNF